jgi:hypothetical protein
LPAIPPLRYNEVEGLAASLAIVLLGGSGIALRYGVQVGETRVHWHPRAYFQFGGTLMVEDSGGGPFIGKARCLGWGAICVYRKAKPGLEPDRHELVLVLY